MSGPPSLKSFVCEEVFDERSQPSEEEVRDFALKIGIDPDAEPYLIPLAREGLLKPLPKHWKPVYDPQTKHYYYFNFKTKQSSWEHPLDSKFRDLVKKSRSESLSSAGEDDSKTSLKEELKSFEETAASIGLESDISAGNKESQMDFSMQKGRPVSAHSSRTGNPLVPTLKSALSPVRSLKKGTQENPGLSKQKVTLTSGRSDLKPIFTPKPLFSSNPEKQSDTPYNKFSKFDWGNSPLTFNDQIEQTKEVQSVKSVADSKYMSFESSLLDESLDSPTSSIIGRFTVDKVHKIDIDSQSKRLDMDSSETFHRSFNRSSKVTHGQSELTLAGGGSVFLKSNKTKGGDKQINESSMLGLKSYGSNSNDDIPDSSSSTPRNLKSEGPSSGITSLTSIPFTRSILRTPQGEKRLWDVDPQDMSVSEKALWKQQELEEEKKSVRFNLDKELNIMFKLSDSSDAESSSKDEGAEAQELISSSGSDWGHQPQQLCNTRAKEINDSSGSSKKEKHMSPLEEWAKKTWFSEKSAFDKKESEIPADLLMTPSHNYSPLLENIHSENENEMIQSRESEVNTNSHVSPGTPNVTPGLKTENDEHQNDEFPVEAGLHQESVHPVRDAVLEEDSTHNACPKESTNFLESEAIFKNTPLKKSSFPSSEDQSNVANEVHFMSTLNRKLEDLISKEMQDSEDSLSREERAREQAYRDWNVKNSDDKMHRPQLSRQQSQQQIKQTKLQVQLSTNVSDRDRALREWSVTKESDDAFPCGTANTASESEGGTQLSSFELQTSKHSSMEKNVTLPTTAGKDKLLSDSMNLKVSSKYSGQCQSERDLKQENERLVHEMESEYKIRLEKDQEEIIRVFQEKLQTKFQEETQNYERKLKDIVAQLERDSNTRMKQMREQLEHKQECATQKLQEEHQKALAAQEVENQATMLRLREQHSMEVKLLREQLQREEEQARREHHERMVSLREDRDGKRSRETTDQLRIIEKLRCEKRIVEDKYKTLKEKYIKLKCEMKINLEKKEQKPKDFQLSDEKGRPSQINPVEEAVSAPQSQQQSDRSSETESKAKTTSSGSSAPRSALGFQQASPKTQLREQPNHSVDPPAPAPISSPLNLTKNNNNEASGSKNPFLGKDFSNDPLQGNIPNSNSNIYGKPFIKDRREFSRSTERNGNIPSTAQEKVNDISPIESLRLQLRTLDELEEQFPASTVTDAYHRYPFSDKGNEELGSAELEFFRHRIHLERDLIRQAKNSLQAQQTEYRSRLHKFQQHQSSSSSAILPSTTLYQMAKEEQELSDMEEKLHRTRSVLSEKIIHLRQLENSLHRLTAPTTQPSTHVSIDGPLEREKKTTEVHGAKKAYMKPQRRRDWKAGTVLWGMEDFSDDISSDSGGSSGFSSTEYTSDGTLAYFLSQPDRKNKKIPENPTDINLSLYNLNAEISEIWNVLCKQRAAAGLGPPPLLNTKAPVPLESTNNSNMTAVTSARTSKAFVLASGQAVSDKGSSLIERTNNLRQWLQKAKMNATLPAADQN